MFILKIPFYNSQFMGIGLLLGVEDSEVVNFINPDAS